MNGGQPLPSRKNCLFQLIQPLKVIHALIGPCSSSPINVLESMSTLEPIAVRAGSSHFTSQRGTWGQKTKQRSKLPRCFQKAVRGFQSRDVHYCTDTCFLHPHLVWAFFLSGEKSMRNGTKSTSLVVR